MRDTVRATPSPAASLRTGIQSAAPPADFSRRAPPRVGLWGDLAGWFPDAGGILFVIIPKTPMRFFFVEVRPDGLRAFSRTTKGGNEA